MSHQGTSKRPERKIRRIRLATLVIKRPGAADQAPPEMAQAQIDLPCRIRFMKIQRQWTRGPTQDTFGCNHQIGCSSLDIFASRHAHRH